MSYKPIDTKRDNFRKYIDNAGLPEMIAKAMANMLTDQPDDPLDYFREVLGACVKDKAHIELLNAKIDKYRLQIEDLEKQLEEARSIKTEPIDTADKSCDEINDELQISIKSEAEIKVEPEEDDSNAENPDPENAEFSSAVDTEEQRDNETKSDDLSDPAENDNPPTSATTTTVAASLPPPPPTTATSPTASTVENS